MHIYDVCIILLTKALGRLHQLEILGHKLVVEFAKSQHKHLAAQERTRYIHYFTKQNLLKIFPSDEELGVTFNATLTFNVLDSNVIKLPGLLYYCCLIGCLVVKAIGDCMESFSNQIYV